MSWAPLSESDGDIAVTPPNFYAIVGSVKESHTQTAILALAKKHGLNVFQYAEQSSVDGYKQVSGQAQAMSASSLPWSLPWPLSIADGSRVTQAWVSPPVDVAAPSTTSEPQSRAPIVIVGLLLASAIGGLAYVFRRGRR